MTIPQTLPYNDPELADVLNAFKKDIFLSLNSHHLGTIQSVNTANQTVSVSINYKRTFFENPSPNVYNPVSLDYPLLLDCPFVVLGGGAAHLTMPIVRGDQCVVLFNDRDINNWFQGTNTNPPASPRLHSLADGIALVGLHSLNNSISNYSADRAELVNSAAKVSLGTSKIKIENNTRNLNSVLQDLITAIKAITVTGVQGGIGTSGPPVNVATFTTIASQLGDLLE